MKRHLSVQRLGVVLAAALMYFGGGATLLANPPICDTTCTTSTSCTDTCYIDQMEFDNGNPTTCLDYGVFDGDTCCGDGFCASDYEDDTSCAADCGLNLPYIPTCGDSSCDVGENHMNCPADCTRLNNCGDGICDGPNGLGGETVSNCPQDCFFTGHCDSNYACEGWETCRAGRCTYDPGADTCADSYDCAVGAKCIGFSSTSPGLCVQMF